jgi:GNAT superfamily N-acetyltransferase
MLDYDLVTPKATYRLVKRDEIEVLTALAARFYDEEPTEKPFCAENMENTVHELNCHPEKGTVFVIEKGNDLVGYAIVINYWSNEYGGNILNIDELYLLPAHRRQGIARDFIGLLERVAPAGTIAMQLEVARANKGACGFYKKIGFTVRSNALMTKDITEKKESNDRSPPFFVDRFQSCE